MQKTPLFQGACTAIVTPYTETGIDYERLRKNLDFQYENGTSAIVVCGTTGEAAMALFARYNALFGALFLETNPIPVKAAMKLLGTDSGILRLPLTEIGEEALQKLKKAMRDVGLLS